jgi:hypothetical protein
MRIKFFQLPSLDACPKRIEGEVLPNTSAFRFQNDRGPRTLPCHPHNSASRPRQHHSNGRFLNPQLLSTARRVPFNAHTAERIEAV